LSLLATRITYSLLPEQSLLSKTGQEKIYQGKNPTQLRSMKYPEPVSTLKNPHSLPITGKFRLLVVYSMHLTEEKF
jgi:hypothetical protein